jgi:CBS-domain-containing membrane protein
MPEFSSHETVSRLRIYISESDRWRGGPLSAAVMDEMRKKGIAGATLFRGAAGFGAHSHLHSTAIEALSMDLPVVIESIDTPEKISAVLEVLYPMVSEGLITREEVTLVKYTHRYLNPLPADLPVSEVMTRDVVHFSPEMKVSEAWKQMVTRQIKGAPVVDNEGNVVGILTDEDLLARAGIQQRLSIAIRLDPQTIGREFAALESSPLIVEGLMTTPVVTVTDSDSLASATTKMVHNHLKRLPVIDASGKLVGILSRLDILRQVVKTTQLPHASPFPLGMVRTVQDVMAKDFPVIDQDDDLPKIVEKFTSIAANHLIVVNEAGCAIGLISDSDVVARIQPDQQPGILAALRRIGKPPVGRETAFDLMSAGVLTSPPETSVVEAAQLMLKNSRKWLVVIDPQNKPLGLVDREILLEALSSVYPRK